MIPKAYITEWRTEAPWPQDAWVEQDLIICRAVVDIFSVRKLAQRLAFRGATALYKLYVTPAARAYSAPLRPPNPENFGHLIRKTSATPVG